MSATEYAGFWVRMGAWVIDILILAIPCSLLRLTPGGPAYTALLGWVYFAYLVSSTKQGTWGMQALGIREIDRDGQRLSFGHAAMLCIANILDGITLGFGLLMIIWTEHKQSLGQMVAGTRTVRDPSAH